MAESKEIKKEKRYILRAIVPIFIGGSALDIAMTADKKRVDSLPLKDATELKKILNDEEKIVTILEEA